MTSFIYSFIPLTAVTPPSHTRLALAMCYIKINVQVRACIMSFACINAWLACTGVAKGVRKEPCPPPPSPRWSESSVHVCVSVLSVWLCVHVWMSDFYFELILVWMIYFWIISLEICLVLSWTYYKWTFIDALMNSCTCHCQKCHKSISDMLSLFDPHDRHRQLAGRGIWT